VPIVTKGKGTDRKDRGWEITAVLKVKMTLKDTERKENTQITRDDRFK